MNKLNLLKLGSELVKLLCVIALSVVSYKVSHLWGSVLVASVLLGIGIEYLIDVHYEKSSLEQLKKYYEQYTKAIGGGNA